MILPLDGIKVLDLSRLLPGPFASQILSDFGAKVIKVEDTGPGDYLRIIPPMMGETSALFHSVNRAKKSIKLDLSKPEGQELFKQLAADADVLLEGFRPGVMDKLGVGYNELKLINPRLIYCTLTGYGSSGPYRDYAGHDINYLSYSGVAGLTGNAGEKPVVPGVQIADIGGGAQWAVISILLALQARGLTGLGQFCDTAMMDGIVSWMPFALALWNAGAPLPQRGREVLNGGYACYNIYETSDNKYVSIGVIEYKFWAEFCDKLGKPEFSPQQMDPAQQKTMIAELNALFKTRTRDEWVAFFHDSDVCFSPLLEFEEAAQSQQLQERHMIIEVDEEHFKGRIMGSPVKLSGTPAQIQTYAPRPGEHTTELLSELGLSSEQIRELMHKGIIG
ncbi:MAG: CaiB/BaiF CoA transferase family protein [Candidatus Saccharibacteria bacterium]